MKKHLGSFKVVSGLLVISDPCYDDSGDWGGVLKARKGNWDTHVIMKGGRVHELVAEWTGKTSHELGHWEKTEGCAGVDSGQMAIFDRDFFLKNSEAIGQPAGWMVPEKGGHSSFYAACCNLTHDPKDDRVGGILPHGVVSQSGHGDGCYPIQIRFINQPRAQVVGVKVRF